MMDENLDLVQYTNRGRPSNAQRLKTPRQTKIEVRNLKKQMNYKDGTEILLAISLVTDDMNRHVAMFPEVMFLDVTANTNRQKRDLFLMVVKDPCGSVYIGNITFIPSGKRWVYDMIYKNFFIILLGKLTISRNRLGLTDDDEAEWGPLDDAIKTIDCWKKSKHMLCNFHALTLAFFEKIHPKLPHKRGGTKRELTKVGNAYGKLLC